VEVEVEGLGGEQLLAVYLVVPSRQQLGGRTNVTASEICSLSKDQASTLRQNNGVVADEAAMVQSHLAACPSGVAQKVTDE
jgi:hypothetical protein